MNLRAAMAQDFRNMLASGLGVAAVYRPVNTSLSLPVTILVSPDVQMPEARTGSSNPAVTSAIKTTTFTVEVASLLPDEPIDPKDGGVLGEAGGVVQLSRGDTFIVDGEFVNRASGTEYVIKITGRIERFPGRWVGGGAL